MKPKELTRAIVQAFIIIVLLIGLYQVVLSIQSVLSYILIAAVVSLVGRPIAQLLKRIKFGNTLSSVTTIAILMTTFFGIVSLLLPVIFEQAKNLSLLNVNAFEATATKLMNELSIYLLDYGVDLQSWVDRSLAEVDYSFLPDAINTVLNGLSGFTIGVFSVIFISFFFLRDSGLLERMVMVFVADKNIKRVEKSIFSIKNLLSRYFIGLLVQITVLFIVYTIVLLIFGIPNAVTIALVCALLNIIPFLGPIIGTVLIVFLTMTSNLDSSFASVTLPKTIYVLIGFTIGQLIDNFLTQPYVFSTSVKSHPLEIFIIILVGGLLFGPLGMIIAVPSYTALKVIFKEFYAHNKIVKALTKNI
ncbi:MAG: AI-2E family transporter [Flavobacteriaceae bacterium]|nr:AI-2E family transporter [Flavobacteriaceae bacterium]|tara:strand:- start:535 stop:1614 length:1080 start_codon:yes stop_codon:yes gene_type:complete